MNHSKSERLTLSSFAEQLRAKRAARSARTALARDLAAYDTPSALLELSAMLERYPDHETREIRKNIDWTNAA